MRLLVLPFFLFTGLLVHAQDSIVSAAPVTNVDTTLRILNLNPYITLHVDSTLSYKLDVNRPEGKFFWYLRNSPVGLRINKDNGTLSFKAEKSFFLSGKLKYDLPYGVVLGVQNVDNPAERIDTSLTMVFYNTEIIPSRVKPSVSSTMYVDEGDVVSFRVQCETGSFPIEHISFFTNAPIKNFSAVRQCDDEFTWSPPYEFVKENDSAKVKVVTLSFIGTTRFMVKDTSNVRIIVRDALNYPLAVQEYQMQVKYINNYILQLKYSFLQLDKKVKKVKTTRTTFDITSSATALTGSIMVSSADASTQKAGKILPGVGVSLVPIKEAVAPQKVYDQNQASQVRSSIKRLEYMLRDNALLTDRDPDVVRKTNRLREELKQIQIQLIDIPIEVSSENMTEEELNQYFNSPKVNKKYRTSRK